MNLLCDLVDHTIHGATRISQGFQVSDRYDLSERLPYLINRVGAALVGFATPSLKKHHLTIPLWRVLAILAHKGELRQVDLAGATSLDPPTISRLISYASRRGLVTRTRSDTSNREVSVRITKSGKDVVEQIIPRMVADETVVFAGLSRAELATLRTILRRMYDNIAGHEHAGGQHETTSPARRAKKR
jgi:MarR family transcriptional regulator, organic hydroperoxide resistance regulator